jgi:predicted transcriptional regulator
MFTMAQFEKNEDNNYHTENGIEMAKHFGTEDEQKLMLQIQKDHYARGHINPDEIEARSGIVKKYWHMLESISEGVSDDEIAKHYRMLKLPSMKSWEKLVKMGLPKQKANEDEGSGHDRQYYRDLDKGQLNHTKSMLMKTAAQLEVAINQRSKFSRELMGNGDKAGTGDLYNMLDKLNKLIEEWDNETELYGM